MDVTGGRPPASPVMVRTVAALGRTKVDESGLAIVASPMGLGLSIAHDSRISEEKRRM